MSDKLEDYVMNITEPLDPLFFEEQPQVKNFDLNQTPLVKVELIDNSEVLPWAPKMPEHSGGSQHLNVGLDFFSATRMESEMVYEESRTKPNYSSYRDDYHFMIVRTGVKMELPYGYHMMIGSRSGLGFKRHIQAFPGIIDHSYRGEVMIKLSSPQPFSIDVGEKIAQGIIFKSQPYDLVEDKVDVNTERGEKGFGSTDLPQR